MIVQGGSHAALLVPDRKAVPSIPVHAALLVPDRKAVPSIPVHAALLVPDRKAVPSIPGHKKARRTGLCCEMQSLLGCLFSFIRAEYSIEQ